MSRSYIYTMSALHGDREGIYYLRGNVITSIDDGRAVIKSAKAFGSVEAAYECLDAWRRLGFRGAPASPAAFFREMLGKMHREGRIKYRCIASVNNLLRRDLAGGWIEAFFRGEIKRPVYEYDLNRAYFAAQMPGVPGRLRPYVRGDRHFVALCRAVSGDFVPSPMLPRHSGRVVVTSEAIERLGLKVDIIDAVSYDALDVNLMPVYYELIDYLPARMFKRCQQAGWGVFVGGRGIVAERRVWDGKRKGTLRCIKRWQVQNRAQNMVWAALIMQRVTCQLAEAVATYGGLSVYIDSVLTTERIPTGDMPGEWKLEDEMPRGAYIRAPKFYDSLPAKPDLFAWKKHAGLPAPIASFL